jgi:uncharacterized damage-inducible protein DinB
MDARIEKIIKTRELLLRQIDVLSAEKLNEIPKGYNNNVIWNLAHLICAQQSLCYLRAGQAIKVDEKYVLPYRTNTKPEKFVEASEIEAIKKTFVDSLVQLQADLDSKQFDNYTASENILKIYGIHLHTIDDALEFLLYHEGFHSGYITAMLRVLD